MSVGDGKRLLVVDDDPGVLCLIKDKFESEGYQVFVFLDAPDVLRHVQRYGLPHLALIDIGLPHMTGFQLSERLKNLGDVPIMFVTGETKVDTVVRALTSYADDYIVKPFEIRELAARVQRVLSRIPDFCYTQPPIIRVDDRLAVDFGQSQLLIGEQHVTLTPTEANLLHILIRNAGRVVTADTLIARVWPAEEIYEDTLRVHMHRLRRKIEPDYHHPKYIQTERGVGYRFISFETRPRKNLNEIPN